MNKTTIEEYNKENTMRLNTKKSGGPKKPQKHVQRKKQDKDPKFRRFFLTILLAIVIFFFFIFLMGKYSDYLEQKSLDSLNQYSSISLTPPINESITSPILTNEQATELYPQETIGYVQIPSVNLKAPIIQAKDSDEFGMQSAMDFTVAHDPSTLLPGEGSNTVIAGHREQQFQRLKDVKENDLIIMVIEENIFLYKIKEVKIVDEDDPEAVDYVYDIPIDGNEQLVLYTCYPFVKWTPIDQRFVVKAERVSVYNDEVEVRVDN